MFENTKALCDSFPEAGIPGFDRMVCHKGECVCAILAVDCYRDAQLNALPY
jgi:hypothetical protein